MCDFRWLKIVVPSVACCLGLFLYGMNSVFAGGTDSKHEIESDATVGSLICSDVQSRMVQLVVVARALEQLMIPLNVEHESRSAVFAQLKVFALKFPELKELVNAIVEDMTGVAAPVFLGNEAESFLWRVDAILLRAAGQGVDFFDTRLFDEGYEEEVLRVCGLLMYLKEALGARFSPTLEYHAATLHDRYRAFNETLPRGDSVYRMVRFIVRNVREVGEALLDLLDADDLQDAFHRVETHLQTELREQPYPAALQFLATQLQVVTEPRNTLRGEVNDGFEGVLERGDSDDHLREDTVDDYWAALQEQPEEAGPDTRNAQAYLDLAFAEENELETVPWAFLNYGGAPPELPHNMGPSWYPHGHFVLPHWSPYHRAFLPTPQQGTSWNSYFMFSPQ